MLESQGEAALQSAGPLPYAALISRSQISNLDKSENTPSPLLVPLGLASVRILKKKSEKTSASHKLELVPDLHLTLLNFSRG